MKVLQLAALFGATVSAAANPLVRRNDRRDLAATTTVVNFITSVNTFTTTCTAAPDCPAGSTVYLTSTTVVDSTTTICSTPGAILPPFGASATPISSSALPLAPGSSSAYPGLPGESSSTPASSAASSGISLPSLPGFTVSVIPGSTLESSFSIVPPTVSATPSRAPVVSGPTSGGSLSSVSATDAVSVPDSSSGGPVPSTPLNTNTDGIHTSLPTGSSSGAYNGPPSSSGVPSNTNTDAVPTSPVSSSAGQSSAEATSSGTYASTLLTPSRYPTGGPSSSDGATPSRGTSLPLGPSSLFNPGSSAAASSSRSGSVPVYPTGPASGPTSSGTYPTVGNATSDSYGPPTPPAESETTVDSTVSVTSYLTQTLTSVVTTPPSFTVPYNISTRSNVEATDISRVSSVSAYPSGSGYARPTGNGTVISPRPTYSEVPINMGHVVGAGKSSLAAIVVALAFAHFA